MKGFLLRHQQLSLRRAQLIDATALTPEAVADHIARLKATCKPYVIHALQQIVNLDESGLSFKPRVRIAHRKTLSLRKGRALTTYVQTRNIDHVTLMGVVTYSGHAFNLVDVFPGVQAHFRTVRGRRKFLHHSLPPCHLFQSDLDRVDSEIFYSSAQTFVEEVKEYRQNNESLSLIFDGHGSHIQYIVLKLLRKMEYLLSAYPLTPARNFNLWTRLSSVLLRYRKSLLNCAAHVPWQLDALNITCSQFGIFSELHVAQYTERVSRNRNMGQGFVWVKCHPSFWFTTFYRWPQPGCSNCGTVRVEVRGAYKEPIARRNRGTPGHRA